MKLKLDLVRTLVNPCKALFVLHCVKSALVVKQNKIGFVAHKWLYVSTTN